MTTDQSSPQSPQLFELAMRDLASRLASEIANHAVTRVQAQLDRAEIAAIRQQLEQLKDAAAKTKRAKTK